MIGIRREDKSQWEARVPLVPADVARLVSEHGVPVCVEASPIRAFPDGEYAAAGAVLADGLEQCPIIMGVKEIPPLKVLPERTYVCFSHTIKGQAANMPMLRRLMELKCQLIDYEKIADAEGRRLVFFGRFAGLAGMIDTLWALGQRLRHEGIDNAFSAIRQAYQYDNLAQARSDIAAVGQRLRDEGLPEPLRPFVVGFTGYGQVSQGAQEIFDLLGPKVVKPGDVASIARDANGCFKVVFREEHMVERVDASSPFDLQEYYQHPDRYRGVFEQFLPYLSVMVNGIYWEPRYPRLATKTAIRELFGGPDRPRLRVIGDISCDINGSVEFTSRATAPDNPVFVYDPQLDQSFDGVGGSGPVVLAVDNLPCELPVDASTYFSRSLSPFVPALAKADFTAPLAESGLPPELRAATIVYQGHLTEPYHYLEPFLRS